MTQYTHTHSQSSNALPAWVSGMAVGTVYEIGGPTSDPGSEIVWPAAGSGNYEMTGGVDNNTYRMHAGYGGSVLVKDIGAHGSLVFGSTGETSIQHQLTRFALSDGAPGWHMYQQPEYAVTAAEAAARGAAWYYSTSDAVNTAVVAAGRQFTTEAAFSTWDGGFPASYAQRWVIVSKYGDSLVGNHIPHWFRYDMPRYIPREMTGTGAGAIIVNSRGTIYGPFSQGPMPAGVGATEAQWFADVWGSGRRKHYLWAKNVLTGAWQRLATPIPDFAVYTGVITSPRACVDQQNKRVYFECVSGSNNALYYADFSAGLAGMTWVGPADVIDMSGGAATSLYGNTVLAVPTHGSLIGRRLWYGKDSGGTAALLLWDLDNNKLWKLAVAGLPPAGISAWWDLGYLEASNELIISIKSQADGMRLYRTPIPSDPTVAANYSMTSSVLPLNAGVTLESDAVAGPQQGGERTNPLVMIDPTTGVAKTFAVWTQKFNKMLACRLA